MVPGGRKAGKFEVLGIDNMIGKTLSHYKVIEKIGQGGMGEVYLTSISHFGITLRRLFQLW